MFRSTTLARLLNIYGLRNKVLLYNLYSCRLHIFPVILYLLSVHKLHFRFPCSTYVSYFFVYGI
jgi:hypothetical protein